MTQLKSSDYGAGWRLRCEGVTVDGNPWAVEGVYNGRTIAATGMECNLAWRLGEQHLDCPAPFRITDITVLDRPSPFEMGARVVHTATGREGVVDAFHLRRDGFPLGAVNIDCGDGVWLAAAPDAFTLAPAPEPLTVEVGSWWATDERQVDAHVVMEVYPDGTATIRAPHERIDGGGVVDALWIAENLTRLPGPPEPKPGDVYVIAPDVWRVDEHGEHWCTGADHPAPRWSVVTDIYTPEQMASLRVLDNVKAGA